jgi:UDP-N-acetylmuramoyl-L-alanyl-D-glutamate--2,6-diaminopimelate ligase
VVEKMTEQSIPPILRPDNPIPVSLSQLAGELGVSTKSGFDDVLLTGISMNTGDLRPGDIFFAMPGQKTHGAKFIDKAIELGAVAVATDAEGLEIYKDSKIPILQVENPRLRLGEAARFVYGNFGKDMPLMFGITGTNGKTSTAHFLAAILKQAGEVAGLSSSVERHIADDVIISRLTSPEAPESHALVARMRENGVTAVAWEVSAQALRQHRVDGFFFDVVAFTNLSHDHFDEFSSYEEYLAAKTPLFQKQRAGKGVVCLDTDWGHPFLAASEVPCLTITLRGDIESDWKVIVTEEQPSYVAFELIGPSGEKISSSVPIIGDYMASNAGVAILMAIQAGHSWQHLASALKNGINAPIAGRGDNVAKGDGPAVYVDFGHTPDSIEMTIQAVRKVTPGKLVVMVGLDGDRDKLKRPMIGAICARLSDAMIVTDHNPRFEDPAIIRDMIYQGAIAERPDHDIRNLEGPERAIRIAMSMVGKGDTILWFGPGHQEHRDIMGVRTKYSGRDQARAALREAGWQ